MIYNILALEQLVLNNKLMMFNNIQANRLRMMSSLLIIVVRVFFKFLSWPQFLTVHVALIQAQFSVYL